MARDLSLSVRKAILAALEDAPAVTAIVPPDRLYAVEPPANPLWPFLRTGFAAPVPFRASGIDGTRLALSLHGFARGPQEDAVSELAAAIAAALDGRVLPLDGDPDARVHLAWTGSRIGRDGDEAGAYHVVIGIEAVVAV